jgi:TonB family protein
MFEFAISQHQKHKPSKRFLICVLMSLVFHTGGLITLIRYPQLLGRGLGNWLDHLQVSPLAKLLEPKLDKEEEKEWRTVTMLGSPSKMALPSEATLKKYLSGEIRKNSANNPPVRVQISKDVLAELSAEKPKPAPQPTLGTEEPKPQPSAQAASEAGTAKLSEEGSSPGKSSMVLPSGGQGDKLVQIIPKKMNEPATPVVPPTTMEAPKRIPETKISPPVPGQEMKTFSDRNAAITQEGSGLFDTKGFPLKEYADVIIARISGNWYIPTTLKNSKGHATVVFYIDKAGRYTNAKIVGSSGSVTFDLTALNAIINSNPFPPLPNGFPGDRIGAKFVFSYNESQ